MAQYIDKAALIAEIKIKKLYAQTLGDNTITSSMRQFYDGMREECNDLLKLLDSLEVKEINTTETL